MSNYEMMRNKYAHDLDDDIYENKSKFSSMNEKYNKEYKPNYLDAFNNAMEKYAAPVAGGILQTGGDIGASLGNLGLKPINSIFGKEYNIPHPNLKQYLPQRKSTDIGFLGGQLATAIIPGSGITKGLQASQRVGGYGGLATQIGKGTGIGYATGETNEGERGLGAAIGGLTGGISSVTANGIQRRVLSDRARQLNQHGDVYKEIFKSADKAGIKNPSINIDKKDLGRVLHRLPEKYRERLSNLPNNPTISGLHEAQSDLGKWIRKVENSNEAKTHTLPLSQQRSVEAAKKIRKELQESIVNSLGEAGLLEESLLYPELTKSYAKNVSPYLSRNISEVAEGKALPKELARKLAADEEFMMRMSGHYPEIGINKAIHSPWTRTILGTGAAAAGIPYGMKQLKEVINNK